MKPRLAFAFLAASVAMGYGVYQVKYEVRELNERAGDLRSEIRDHREAIDVLDVEWAYLTRPTRLEELGERYLNLGAVRPEQIVPVQDIDVALSPKGGVSSKDDRLASARSNGQ